VRGVQVHGKPAAEAVAGQRTAINLGGVDVADVSRGQTLVAPGSVSVTRRIDADVNVLPAAKALKHGARVRLHNGTSEVLGRVSIAGPSSSVIGAGERALVRVRLESEAVLNRGDRFILRAYSPPVTIGGGRVLDPMPTRAGIRSEAALTALGRLAITGEPGSTADREALLEMIVSADRAGMLVSALISRGGVSPSRLSSVIDVLAKSGVIARAGERLVGVDVLDRSAKKLIDMVTAFHRANPLSDGLPREEAREKILARSDPAIFEAVIERLATAKKLAGKDRLALPTHRVQVSGDDARVKAALADAYRAAGLKPPDAAALAEACKSQPAVIDKMTQLLTREKVLVRVDTLLFHSAALQQLKDDVSGLKTGAPDGRATVDVATFKERYGISRKFAIPLLEYLDRERVTRRTGDVRLVI
jgi:selenocysteine-specific elongation factor